MNYHQIYSKLVERAKTRTIDGYKERHHVLPKCLGGSDLAENIVELTAEEHYIAHLLLVKMYPDKSKLAFAANMMANRNRKRYSIAKKWHAAALSKRLLGKKRSKESIEKQSLSTRGVSKSDEHKSAIAKSKTQRIEYRGNFYLGWDDLKNRGGISQFLYRKYYGNPCIDELISAKNIWKKPDGVDEEIKASLREKRRQTATGRHWYNDGSQEFFLRGGCPNNMREGRLNAKSKS